MQHESTTFWPEIWMSVMRPSWHTGQFKMAIRHFHDLPCSIPEWLSHQWCSGFYRLYNYSDWDGNAKSPHSLWYMICNCSFLTCSSKCLSVWVTLHMWAGPLSSMGRLTRAKASTYRHVCSQSPTDLIAIMDISNVTRNIVFQVEKIWTWLLTWSFRAHFSCQTQLFSYSIFKLLMHKINLKHEKSSQAFHVSKVLPL